MTRFPALLAAIAAIASTAPAVAVETPRPGAADPRIKTVDFDPLQVVRLVGAFRTATQILFADDETIQHVALGDTSGWEVVAEKNILFAKPTAVRAPTNLIVTTATASGRVRNYTFELATRGGPTSRASPDTFFVVRFRYPADEKQSLSAALTTEAQALERRIVRLKLERGVLEGPRNLTYELQGSAAIAPSEVSDNGRFTVLRFPGAQAVPSVYAITPDGSESLVPFDVRGEFLVIHQTGPQFRLRRGREVLCLFNRAWRPVGVNLGTGTAAPDVDRTLTETPRP
ncbi:MAG: TrbG/VirB9 family P-type conjugative transfer protein [Phenylobacterium sp.]